MKTKKFLVIILVPMLFALSSCKKEIVAEQNPVRKDSVGVREGIQDSLEAVYMMQSNLDLLLADRIISKPDGFILDISQQEANELDIPEELYRKYIDKVAELNKSLIRK